VDEEAVGTEILRLSTEELPVVDLSTVACMKIKSRLNPEHAYWYSVHALSSSRLIPKVWTFKYAELWLCVMYCGRAKLTVSQWGKNAGWDNLVLRGESGGDCIERSGTLWSTDK